MFPFYYYQRCENQMKAEREIEEKLKEGKRRRRNEIKEKQTKKKDIIPFDPD